MSDYIELTGIEVDTLIGVHGYEQRRPRKLRIDLRLFASLAAAGQSDAVADTIDYSAVSAEVREFAARARFALIEAFAEQLCAQLLETHKLDRIKMTVHKPGAVPGTAVSIRIDRRAM